MDYSQRLPLLQFVQTIPASPPYFMVVLADLRHENEKFRNKWIYGKTPVFVVVTDDVNDVPKSYTPIIKLWMGVVRTRYGIIVPVVICVEETGFMGEYYLIPKYASDVLAIRSIEYADYGVVVFVVKNDGGARVVRTLEINIERLGRGITNVLAEHVPEIEDTDVEMAKKEFMSMFRLEELCCVSESVVLLTTN